MCKLEYSGLTSQKIQEVIQMSKTNELLKQIKENAKKSSGNSRKDLNAIAKTMLNYEEYEATYYSADSEGNPVEKKQSHVKAFRDATADNVASCLNLDKDDRDRVAKMPISSKMAESMMDVAIDTEMEYLGTGRKLSLPTMDKNAARAGIQMKTIEEKVKETSKIVDGKMVPTGKRVTTFEHDQLKVKSTVFPWQKKSEDI